MEKNVVWALVISAAFLLLWNHFFTSSVKPPLNPVAKSEVPVTAKDLSKGSKTYKEEKVEKKNYYHLERSYGSFSRSFTLPAEVQTDKAKATFKNGLLEVRVPKTEEAKKKTQKVKIE